MLRNIFGLIITYVDIQIAASTQINVMKVNAARKKNCCKNAERKNDLTSYVNPFHIHTEGAASNHVPIPNEDELIWAEYHKGKEHVGGKVKSKPLGVVVEHFWKKCVDDDTEEEKESRSQQDVGIEVELRVILLPRAHFDHHGLVLMG